MAKCKLCNTDIPDGSKYCKDCREKKLQMANESYLDNLLNSVKNTESSSKDIYKKKNKPDTADPAAVSDRAPYLSDEPDIQAQGFDAVDQNDIDDFEQYYIKEDFLDIPKDIVITEEELFGGDAALDDRAEAPDPAEHMTAEEDAGEEDITSADEPVFLDELHMEESASGEEDNNVSLEEISEFGEEEDFDYDLNDLLNNIETFQSEEEDQSREDGSLPKEELEEEGFSDSDPSGEEEDDILNLLNQISPDDPMIEDVKAINELLNGAAVRPLKEAGPSDVGEVFSDALKVVTSLNDNEEADILDAIPDKLDKKAKKAAKKKKKKDREKVKDSDDLGDSAEEKPRKSLINRLFGNVEATGKKSKTVISSQQEEAAAKETAEKSRDKSKDKSKDKNRKNAVAAEADAPDDKDEDGRNKDAKRKQKEEKKAKKKQTRDAIRVIDEIEEDKGRINRLGATIVFAFFGLLLALILIGTETVSYALSIQNASTYFGKHKYTEAYYEVYGMDIKDEDIELYSKIMTVMYVNKQLNSYNSYYSLGMYPQALDSLLKGMKRYNKYIELATLLGIESDLKYVKNQLLAELDNVFGLSEEDAVRIISFENITEYSLEVYDVVLANEMNKN